MSDGVRPRETPAEFDVDVESDRTIVTVSGDRQAAVVVYSNSGERIYLPPEAGADDGSDPYRPAGVDSPYEGDRGDRTPYGSTRRSDPSVGMNPTPDGFRIHHPEPVHDVRLLRREGG